MLADLISAELPYLRRYARGLMGEQERGDEAVEDMIESLIFRISMAPDLKFRKADLFAELDKTVRAQVAGLPESAGIGRILNDMTTEQRRALLLTVVEGFTVSEAAHILGISEAEVEQVLRDAETSISNAVTTSVLIIEDEPLISYQLSTIVREAGHSVAAVATTRGHALELAGRHDFGLILSDIRLADDSSGIGAVKDILSAMDSPVPVVFITAYPEMLLQGQADEPAYLIPKPFDLAHVRTIVDQAILSAFLGEGNNRT